MTRQNSMENKKKSIAQSTKKVFKEKEIRYEMNDGWKDLEELEEDDGINMEEDDIDQEEENLKGRVKGILDLDGVDLDMQEEDDMEEDQEEGMDASEGYARKKLSNHRIRFIHYLNSKILNIKITRNFIAVGKENGNINIYTKHKSPSYYHFQTLISSPHQGLQVIEWISPPSSESLTVSKQSTITMQKPRLISAGLSGQIIEWDIDTGIPISTTSSFGGAIWCMQVNPNHDILAIGCEDGAVRLFRILPECGLEYLSALERQPCKVVSLAWHPTKPIILTGGTQGRARVLHLDTGRAIHHLTLDAAFVSSKIDPSGTADSTIVWQVLILKDGTLVTGDSLGHVCFWQGRSGTLIKKFPVAHLSDVLSMTSSKDGQTVYTSGVDRKICQFKQIQVSKSSVNGVNGKVTTKSLDWMVCGEKRYHTHDVHALALLEDQQKHGEFLVSGGVDTNLIFSGPTKTLSSMRQERLEMTPQYTPITLARDQRVIMCMFDDCLKLWRLSPDVSIPNDSRLFDGQRLNHAGPHKHILTLTIPNGDSNLVCSDISQCGTWVVCSTIASVKLFYITYNYDDDDESIKVKQIKSSVLETIRGAWCATFTPDSTRLVLANTDGQTRIVALDETSKQIELIGQIHNPVGKICGIYVSPSNRFLIISSLSSSSLQVSTLTSYDMDTLQKWATLPSFSSLVTAASFQQQSKGEILGLVTVSNQIIMIDVEKNEMTDWCRRNMIRFPTGFTNHRDTIRGIFFKGAHKVIVWASSYHLVIDLTRDIYLVPRIKSKIPHSSVSDEQGGDVGRGDEGGPQHHHLPDSSSTTRFTGSACTPIPDNEQHFILDHRYTGIMYLGEINEREWCVVERPALQVLAELPAAFKKHKYGN